MKQGRMVIRDAVDTRRFLMMLDGFERPFTLAWTPGEKRTNNQNNTIHMWFQDVVDHFGDTPFDNVKAECNLQFGRPILERDDPEWSSAFGYIFDALSLPAKLKAIRVLDIPFTRRMTVPQQREYMDAMQRHYAEIGVSLRDPEARKYEGEFS